MKYSASCGWVIVLAGSAALLPGPRMSTAAPPAPAAAQPPSGPAYAIRLTRPVPVGARYHYVAEASFVESVSGDVSGQHRSLKPQSASVRFEATEQVLAVNARGEPSKVAYTVEQCIRRDGKRQFAFLPRGRVLTVEAGRFKAKLTVDEGTLPVVDELVLRRVVPMPALKGVTLDDCFGTATPRGVGESWPVNAVAFAQWASQEGAKVTAKDVSGTVRLKAIQAVDGVPHLLVSGRAVIQHYAPDAKELTDIKMIEATDEIKFTKIIPAEGPGHCLTDSNSEKELVKARVGDGALDPDIVVDVNLLRTLGIKRTPLPSGPVVSQSE